nr:hypothetical protein [Tanacetum cinerariifolium]
MFEAKTGAYRFQLYEDWFRLDANLLKEALEITPIDQAYQFVSPPSGDAIMDSVNQLGYPGEIHVVSRMAMLWGIITRLNIDYDEFMWEEFVQAIQTFLVDKANLGRHHNIHQRSGSPLNLAEDDLSLGNLKFVPKGEIDEVFGMKIPKELVTDNIKNAPYYNDYLEMVAKHERRIVAEKEGGKKKMAPKASKPVKPAQAKPTIAKQPKPKPIKEKSTKPAPLQKASKGKVTKTRNVKSSLQLVDEPDKEQDQPVPEPEPQGAGKGKAIATKEQAAQSLLALHMPKKKSTTDQFILQRRTPATEEASTGPSAQPRDDTFANIVCETPSPADAEIGVDMDNVISEGDTEILNIGKEQGEDVDNQVYLEEQTAILDEGQAGSDPGKTLEPRPPPDDDKMDEDQAGSDPGKSYVALVGPSPEPMHDDFVATVYPKVHESLNFLADEQVILEDLLSSSRTLFSMKNLDDTYTFGDQFFNDKSIEDEPRKQNVDAKVVSMVTVPTHQTSISVPPLSTPIIDLLPPQPIAYPLPEPFTTATTETTTTILPLPPPPQQQSITNSELPARVTALEKKFVDFEQKSQTLDNMTQNLGSRVFTLELQDPPHKINQTVKEVVKEAIRVAFQAPLRDRFREMPEDDMKEIIHQRMFESGSYKSLPGHVALYESLEASMERANLDEFLAKKYKSRKRLRDDQDPPPPPDSDLIKKKRHNSAASGSKQPPAPQSSAWKTFDTREAPSSSSKQHSAPQSEQPVEDVLVPDTMSISDSKDIDIVHLPKIKTRPDWLKPILEEYRPSTPEPDWVIPPNDLLETKKNWANALASSYQYPDKYKLLRQTECHLLLIDQVDLVNPEGHRVVPDVSKPLPLRGPPSQVTIQTQYFFNKDLEYLLSGDKGIRSTLSISKLKVAQYLHFRLEELVSSLWIESEREYDTSAAYGISHWWFKRKEFYITRHSAPSDRSTVKSHMRILSLVSLKTFEKYGYTFLKKILLHRVDYNEYKISEVNFKNLHLNDFEDLYLLYLQGQLNHLSSADKVHLFNAVNLWIRNIVIRKRVEDLQLRIKSYQTKLNLTQLNLNASDFLFKEDYTIVSKLRAVIFRDSNDQKKMMRESEYNPSIETRIWSEDDRRRSKEFMEVIERRLKIRRIFRSLESFIGGRLRDVDYRLIQRTE